MADGRGHPSADGADVAPDGSPVLLYLVLPGDDPAARIDAAVPAGAGILELGCGAGRVTRHLVGRGHGVTGVDNSPEMLAHLAGIRGAEPVEADIATLDLRPRRWPAVTLASHLVNHAQGARFLAAAARHVEVGGCVVVERHEPGWLDEVEESTAEQHGVTFTLQRLHRPARGELRAVIVYEVAGRRFEQAYTALEVDDERLAAMAAAVGLAVDAVLDERGKWVRLVPG